MTPVTRKSLTKLLEGIPILKRQLNPDLSNNNDQRRLIELALLLLINNDTFETSDIQSVCEEVGGDKYLSLINEESFIEDFANPIYARIDDIKNIIDMYRIIKAD
jgi:hypothetical protein